MAGGGDLCGVPSLAMIHSRVCANTNSFDDQDHVTTSKMADTQAEDLKGSKQCLFCSERRPYLSFSRISSTDFMKKISYLAAVEFYPPAEIPGVCKSCLRKVNTTYEFVFKIRSAIKKWGRTDQPLIHKGATPIGSTPITQTVKDPALSEATVKQERRKVLLKLVTSPSEEFEQMSQHMPNRQDNNKGK